MNKSQPYNSRGTKNAIVLGATGLVGSDVLKRLLVEEIYTRVISLNRRTLPIQEERLTQHLVDMNEIEKVTEELEGGDAFCCIGTTIKKAGSHEQYRRIEFDYALSFAKMAKRCGVKHFLIVTAYGASTEASSFHLKVKGEIETAILSLGFDKVTILRPMLLIGQRSEFRLTESFFSFVFRRISKLLVGPFEKFKAVDSSAVGWRMVNEAVEQKKSGVKIIAPDQIELH